MNATRAERVALAMTGASGAPYGLRLLEALLDSGREVELTISAPGRICLATECDLRLPASPIATAERLAAHLGPRPGRLSVYAEDDWMAPLASGSNPPAAMVVCPCTSGTLAAIATGQSRSLAERAAEVMLKERRPLVLVHRETPLSAIVIENMLRLTRAGAVLLPANPGFYHRPRTVEALVDFVVARILDHLGVDHGLGPRWGAERREGREPAE